MEYIKIIPCNETFTQTLSTGKEIQHTITSTLECYHQDVEKIWRWGSGRPGATIYAYLSFIMKDGGRKDFPMQGTLEATIAEAEIWLNNLNIDKQ